MRPELCGRRRLLANASADAAAITNANARPITAANAAANAAAHPAAGSGMHDVCVVQSVLERDDNGAAHVQVVREWRRVGLLR